MRWTEIVVSLPDGDSAEATAAVLTEAGCAGVVQLARPDGTVTDVVGYLPVDDLLEGRLDEVRDRLGRMDEFALPAVGQITLRTADEAEWADAWKQYFKPLLIGQRLVIKPSWELYAPQPGQVVIELDPGMAFGTGGHPTTRLCLAAIERLVQPGMKVADIGCGSGILSLAAARLGAQRVTATEIDALPAKVARENVARSGLTDRIEVHYTGELSALQTDAPYDLVVSNILADTIIRLAPGVHPLLAPGGLFLSSGIVDERADEVRASLAQAGFGEIEREDDGEWVLFTARR